MKASINLARKCISELHADYYGDRHCHRTQEKREDEKLREKIVGDFSQPGTAKFSRVFGVTMKWLSPINCFTVSISLIAQLTTTIH